MWGRLVEVPLRRANQMEGCSIIFALVSLLLLLKLFALVRQGSGLLCDLLIMVVSGW